MTDKTRDAGPQKAPAIPPTDEIEQIQPIQGGDRSGLGAEGWAEVPEHRIGGHPELETVSASGPEGAINGPQPETDRVTGTAKHTPERRS